VGDTIALVFVVLAVATSTGAVLWFQRNRVIGRYLRRARRYTVADFPEGHAGTLVGHIRPLGEPVIAPMTGRRCVFYAVTFSFHNPGPTLYTHNRFHIVGRRSSAAPFALEDETGRALIEPDGAMVVGFESATTGGSLRQLTETQRQYLNAVGIVPRIDLQFSETILGPDARITVVGAGSREADPDATAEKAYRADRPTRLRLSTSRSYRLMFFDKVVPPK
jgi:hypothetical protein